MLFNKNKKMLKVKGVLTSTENACGGEVSVALQGDDGRPFFCEETVSAVTEKVENPCSIESKIEPLNDNKCRKTSIIGNIWLYSAAPLIAVAFFIAFVAYCGIYPFGNRMMASYDMLAQIVPYAEHFFDDFPSNTSKKCSA